MKFNHKTAAAVTSISYHLPERILTNEEICAANPKWTSEKIYQKTGVRSRHIAAPGETAMDLGFTAAKQLLATGACRAEEIDLLLFCTQTPDYALPTSACILQNRLGLLTSCAAFDFNLGCSGFVYGLGVAKGMLETGQAAKALVITAETYSKWIDPHDASVLTIFGDGAAASLVELVEDPSTEGYLGPFVYGTDGSGYRRLIVPGSGARRMEDEPRDPMPGANQPDRLYMDGAEIFAFTIRSVPDAFRELLRVSNESVESLDLICCHQANAYMLNDLRRRMQIPEDKFVIAMSNCGNTVSSSIPIALAEYSRAGKLQPGQRIGLIGFGVGYSWAAAVLVWQPQLMQTPSTLSQH